MTDEQLLEQMEGTEFGNFFGLASPEDMETFLGVIRRNPKRFKRAMTKMTSKINSSAVSAAKDSKAASRAEMEARFNMLPASIQKALREGRMQLSDHVIVSTKSIGSSRTVKMFEEQDNPIVGVCNINNAKLDQGEYFLLSGIRLLYGVGASAVTPVTQAAVAAISAGWDLIPHAIECGEFELGANGKTLIEKLPASVFKNHMNKTVSNTTPAIVGGVAFGEGLPGYMKLANPKIIKPQDPIKMPIEFVTAAPASTYLRVELYGTIVRIY